MHFYWFLLGVLSVWRLTHLLFAEDGPWDLIVRMRGWVGEGFWGKLLDCFYCLSLWIAVPFAFLIGEALKERLLLWLALSGGAVLIERVAFQSDTLSPGQYVKDEEKHNELLRPEERAIPPSTHGSDNP